MLSAETYYVIYIYIVFLCGNFSTQYTLSFCCKHFPPVISVQKGGARRLCLSVYGFIAGIVTLCTGEQPLLYVHLTERLIVGQSAR